MLADYGYSCQHDDVSPAAFGKCRFAPDEIHVEAEMDRARIDRAVKKVADGLTRLTAVTDDLVARVELLLGEFLTNLHDHGFEGVTRHKECAQVRVAPAGDQVAVTVWHRAMPWSLSAEGDSPDAALESANARFAGHDRGVPIIRKLCRSMTAQSFGGLNVNTFYVPLTAEE